MPTATKQSQIKSIVRTSIWAILTLSLPAMAQITLNGQPCPSCAVSITTAPVTPPVTPPPVTPPVITAPPVITPGVVIVDANPWRGNNPTPLSYTMGRDQAIAFRIPASSFVNDSYIVEKVTAAMAMSISATPGDFADAAGGQNKGCYFTVGGAASSQTGIRAIQGGVSGYATCPTPANNGFLYVNVRWSLYDNFGSKGALKNYLNGPQGAFTLRRDG